MALLKPLIIVALLGSAAYVALTSAELLLTGHPVDSFWGFTFSAVAATAAVAYLMQPRDGD